MAASPSSVITGGFGVPGSANLVITDGFGAGAPVVPPAPAPAPATPGGIRHSRFLRRGPKLPWEIEPEVPASEVVIAKPKRKRIKMPAIEAMRRQAAPIPVETVLVIDAPVITVPELGSAVVKLVEQEEDDLLLWLI